MEGLRTQIGSHNINAIFLQIEYIFIYYMNKELFSRRSHKCFNCIQSYSMRYPMDTIQYRKIFPHCGEYWLYSSKIRISVFHTKSWYFNKTISNSVLVLSRVNLQHGFLLVGFQLMFNPPHYTFSNQ